MALTPEEKHERKRLRMIETARRYRLSVYRGVVAKVFQRMVRAESAARPAGLTPAVVDGEMADVFRNVGQCVCVTCGKVFPWNNPFGGRLDTGHCVPGRTNAIVFDEDGVAAQCVSCNRDGSGVVDRFKMWVAAVRGADTLARIEKKRYETRTFTKEELVDLKMAYQTRLNAALKQIKEFETLPGGDAK